MKKGMETYIADLTLVQSVALLCCALLFCHILSRSSPLVHDLLLSFEKSILLNRSCVFVIDASHFTPTSCVRTLIINAMLVIAVTATRVDATVLSSHTLQLTSSHSLRIYQGESKGSYKINCNW
jgi:hypothetical protein